MKPNGLRGIVFRIVQLKQFENLIMLTIMINTLVLGTKHNNMDDVLEIVSQWINDICSIIFNLEMILKFIGFGKFYFYNVWNLFDMFIVIVCDVGFLIDLFGDDNGFSTTASVLRGFRMMRLIKLVGRSVHIRLIIDTILNIMPQVMNVMLLLLLSLFIYSCFAINLFSGVML